ncbi:hypothetical protein HZS_2153, partial [Henneguya salminicola]
NINNSLEYSSKIYTIDKNSSIINTLKSLGAICCGYSSITKNGINPYGINPFQGEYMTRNPYNNRYYISGGEPGDASIVATGICPFAISYDKLASSRLSAGAVGIMCLRPTYNSISAPEKYNFDEFVTWQTNYLNKKYDANANIFCCPKLKLSSLRGIRFGYYKEYIMCAEKNFCSIFDKFLNKIYFNAGNIIYLVLKDLNEIFATFLFFEAKSIALLNQRQKQDFDNFVSCQLLIF